MIFLERPQDSKLVNSKFKGSNHFEGMWCEPPEKESRAPEWFLLGLRGHSVPPLEGRPALLAGSGRGR